MRIGLILVGLNFADVLSDGTRQVPGGANTDLQRVVLVELYEIVEFVVQDSIVGQEDIDLFFEVPLLQSVPLSLPVQLLYLFAEPGRLVRHYIYLSINYAQTPLCIYSTGGQILATEERFNDRILFVEVMLCLNVDDLLELWPDSHTFSLENFSRPIQHR